MFLTNSSQIYVKLIYSPHDVEIFVCATLPSATMA